MTSPPQRRNEDSNRWWKVVQIVGSILGAIITGLLTTLVIVGVHYVESNDKRHEEQRQTEKESHQMELDKIETIGAIKTSVNLLQVNVETISTDLEKVKQDSKNQNYNVGLICAYESPNWNGLQCK